MFVDYFWGKIKTIREDLISIPNYTPTVNQVPKLKEFRTLEQREVNIIINSLSTKSCELDCLPTYLLKEILMSILPLLTKIINVSLEQGTFTACWKVAIIRPLIKKVGLDLIANNYRPVSNLSFLSKVLGKAALDQIMEHCKQN